MIKIKLIRELGLNPNIVQYKNTPIFLSYSLYFNQYYHLMKCTICKIIQMFNSNCYNAQKFEFPWIQSHNLNMNVSNMIPFAEYKIRYITVILSWRVFLLYIREHVNSVGNNLTQNLFLFSKNTWMAYEKVFVPLQSFLYSCTLNERVKRIFFLYQWGM